MEKLNRWSHLTDLIQEVEKRKYNQNSFEFSNKITIESFYKDKETREEITDIYEFEITPQELFKIIELMKTFR